MFPRRSDINNQLAGNGDESDSPLGDSTAITDAARTVAELTHADPLAADSCVLWCTGVDTAVREGTFDGLPEFARAGTLLRYGRRHPTPPQLDDVPQGASAGVTNSCVAS